MRGDAFELRLQPECAFVADQRLVAGRLRHHQRACLPKRLALNGRFGVFRSADVPPGKGIAQRIVAVAPRFLRQRNLDYQGIWPIAAARLGLFQSR
jgi:hypothetical protein